MDENRPTTHDERKSALYFALIFAIVALIVTGVVVFAASFSRRSLDVITSSQQIDHHERLVRTIDLVYTWVDASDPEWKEQKNFYRDRRGDRSLPSEQSITTPAAEGDAAEGDAAEGDADAARFPLLETRDCKQIELYWSMISVSLYAPWVRRVYIVTQRPQRPFWLQYDEDAAANMPGIDALSRWRGLEIAIVHHDRILEQANLPVFNSVAIESGLYRCPHLAEHFLYFNDDTYIGAPLFPSALFDSGGRPYLRTLSRVSRYVTSLFDKRQRFCWAKVQELGLTEGPLAHQGVALTKSIMRDASVHFADEWRSTARSRFRRALHDIPPIGMSLMYAYDRGHVYVQPQRSEILRMCCAPILENVAMCAASLRMTIPIASCTAPHLFCINPQAIWPNIDDAFKHAVLPHLEQFYASADCEDASFFIERPCTNAPQLYLFATSVLDAVFHAHEILLNSASSVLTIVILLSKNCTAASPHQKYLEECISSFYRRPNRQCRVHHCADNDDFELLTNRDDDTQQFCTVSGAAFYAKHASARPIQVVSVPEMRTRAAIEIVQKLAFDLSSFGAYLPLSFFGNVACTVCRSKNVNGLK